MWCSRRTKTTVAADGHTPRRTIGEGRPGERFGGQAAARSGGTLQAKGWNRSGPAWPRRPRPSGCAVDRGARVRVKTIGDADLDLDRACQVAPRLLSPNVPAQTARAKRVRPNRRKLPLPNMPARAVRADGESGRGVPCLEPLGRAAGAPSGRTVNRAGASLVWSL